MNLLMKDVFKKVMTKTQIDAITKSKIGINAKIAVALAFLGASALVAAGAPANFNLTQPKIKSFAVVLQPGCFLQVQKPNGKLFDYNLFNEENSNKCTDAYLALRYVRHSGSDKWLNVQRFFAAKNINFNLQSVISNDDTFTIYFAKTSSNGAVKINALKDLKDKIKSDKCERISFLGVQLHCFNEVLNKKESNLSKILTWVTILRYFGNEAYQNDLYGGKISPWGYVRDESGVVYYDASSPELFGETTETTKCGDEYGAANYQIVGSGEKRVYICGKLLNPKKVNTGDNVSNGNSNQSSFDSVKYELNLLKQAIMLYHEALHQYANTEHKYYHDEDVAYKDLIGELPAGFENLEINNECKIIPSGEYWKRKRDSDFKSVYGQQIIFEKQIFQSSLPSCKVRKEMYKIFQTDLLTLLCQYPNKPVAGDYTEPQCN